MKNSKIVNKIDWFNLIDIIKKSTNFNKKIKK